MQGATPPRSWEYYSICSKHVRPFQGRNSMFMCSGLSRIKHVERKRLKNIFSAKPNAYNEKILNMTSERSNTYRKRGLFFPTSERSHIVQF